MGCGLLATALGLGGWAIAGQHAGDGHPGQAGPQRQAGQAGRAGQHAAAGSAGRSGGHRPANGLGTRGPAGRAGQVPVPPGLSGRAPSGQGQRRIPRPVRLVIPAIKVETRLTRLGITRQRTMQVPASAAIAGWFTGSPPPGAVGASIIAGHIDSYSGPGVFFRLRDLHRGEHVIVTRANGPPAAFRITAVRTYAKDRFPTARVYGPVPDAELRLITCGGQFDYASGSYLSNVVVYAVLVR